MSVIYRALWASKPESTAEYLAQMRELFSEWATETQGCGGLSDGDTGVRLNRTRQIAGSVQRHLVDRLIGVRTVSGSESRHGFEGTTRETADGVTWTTAVRVVVTGDTAHVWVDNQAESDRHLGVRLSVGRPRVVDDLISASHKATFGGSRLQVETLDFPSAGVPMLAEHLRAADRVLPTIVVSQPLVDDGGAWLVRADRISRRVAGVATVARIDRSAATALRNELGLLATWDGSVRVYAPVPVVDGEGYRHRYTLRNRLEDGASERAQIDRIVYGVCSLSTRRKPDPAFEMFAAPVTESVDLSGYLSIDDADTMIRDLQGQLDIASEEARAAVDEQDLASRELSLKIGHLDRLRLALENKGIFDLFWETQHDPGSGIPDEAEDVDSAIILAMDFLSDWVVIHEDAPQELDGINTSPKSGAWGNATWRGFRALAAFAKARSEDFAGDFFDWCKSDPPLGWSPSPKKLSMTESDPVRNNTTLSGKRVLPISTDVNSEGRALMLAHLKISEGGGNLAPRVYFYDDTAGVTKKVHIGFVGPHYLMPNTRS